MNKHIIITALCFLFALEVFAQAGPTNGDQYRSFIRTTGFSFGHDHNGDDVSNRVFFLLKGDESSGTTQCLFDTTSGAGYDVSTVYNTATGPAPHANTSSGTIKEVINTESPDTMINVTMMAWDHGCGSSGDFHYDPSCDFHKEAACFTINAKEGAQSQYVTNWYTIEDSSQIRMQKVWRPTFGENYKAVGDAKGPLTFGQIGPNEYRVHENGNRRRPSGAPIDLGYRNWWFDGVIPNFDEFNSSPDVTYSFTVTQNSYVIISLDFPETNLNSRLYVVQTNPDGTPRRVWGYRNEDINNGSGKTVLSHPNIPAGSYYLVIEGKSNDPSDWGDYKMTVALPTTYEAGTITHDNLSVPQGCILQAPIVSGDTPQTSLGDLEFQWEYKLASEPTSMWKDLPGATSETLSPEELGPINDTIDIRRRLRSMGGAAYTNKLTFDVSINRGDDGYNGEITGKVLGPSNGASQAIGVKDVWVYAYTDPHIPGSCLDSAKTNAQGDYTLINLYYGSDPAGATFTIYPEYLDHEFSPTMMTEIQINSDNPRSVDDFVDNTAVFISGEAYQVSGQDTCGLPDVGIFLSGIERIKTNEDGSYNLPASVGTFDVTADLENGAHTFTPLPDDHNNLELIVDTTGIDFKSTTTHNISGSITALGGYCFGGVEILLEDITGCFQFEIETDSCGVFNLDVPARNYYFSINPTDIGEPNAYDHVAMSNYFSTDTIYAFLTAADTVFNLVYRQDPEIISITGITPNICGDTVLDQGQSTIIDIDISEINVDGYPIDTGIIMLIDEISGRDTVWMPISNGLVEYEIIPDTPYLYPQEPYQHLEITALSLDSTRMSESIILRAIVTGVKAGNTTFTSVSPEIPFLILRDPPGDMSYAELIEEETSETSLSFSTLIGGNVTTWSKTKVGAKFEAGLGFSTETEAWGSVEGKMSIGASNATNEEFTVSMTNTSAYKTDDSGTPELIGSGGDLFVGAALNLLYARADVLSYDTQVCQDTQTVEIIMGTESLKTEFAYTDFFIRNSVMPELAFLRDNGPQDSIVWYQDQIELWQQTLDRNDYLKSIADSISTSAASRSFGGNITLSESTTTTSTRKSEFEFKLEVSSELAVEAGLEVGGAGASGGVQVSMRAEIGLGGSSTNLKSRTTKYVLKDNETLDKHFIRIRECPVYSTPIFEEIGSNTSCPYTPGTVNRDKPTLTVANPIRTGVDPMDGETFIFTIRNESKSGETRSYYLDLIESSNLNSAIIGENITGDDRRGPFPIGFNEEVDVQIFVSKSQFSEVFSYEDLTFIAYPECDDITSYQPQTSSTTAVSVFFDSPCSDVTMNLPQDNWEVSQSSNNILLVNMSVENVQFMDSVSIEYSQTGKNSWTTALTLDDSEVTSNDIAIDVSDITDGLYDIRLKLYCDGGTIFTSRSSGIIDREAPVVFGIPSPIDDDYDQSANDEISVSFEEDIACANASVLLTDMETLEVIPATLSCSGNKAIIVPDIVLDSRGPAIYRVTLSGVEDLYANVRDDYRWVFIVGDYIYDPDCSPVNISNNNVDQDAISQSVYRATEITSDGTVGTATQVGYVAQEGVSLESGFTVNEDGGLEVNIENCND